MRLLWLFLLTGVEALAPLRVTQRRQFWSLSAFHTDEDEPDDMSDLAQSFAEELQRRQEAEQGEESALDIPDTPSPPSRTKFTGASLFSPSSPPPPPPPPQPESSPARERIRQQEFRLASRFEQTLGIQAVLVVAALAFVIGVGLSGGLDHAELRNFDDELDSTTIEYLDQIRSDQAPTGEDERSIWI